MPSVLIERRSNSEAKKESAIMNGVHRALCDAFKIKPTDRHVRLIVHEPHRFLCPPGKANPEEYTHISMDIIEGRSIDAKRALYNNVVENLEPLGIPKDHVKIVIRDIPTTNWGIRGGQAACDVDLGFKVDI